MENLILYTFRGTTRYPRPQSQQIATPGQIQGVLFTMPADIHEEFLTKVQTWFADREEIEIVDYGTTDKQELGYIILEWDECQIDKRLLSILSEDDLVEDYTTYVREV